MALTLFRGCCLRRQLRQSVYGGRYPDDMYHMLRLACETQSPSRVVYELDPSYWMNEQRSGSTQIFFYQEFPASRSKFFYFLDKIINLDFRSALLRGATTAT